MYPVFVDFRITWSLIRPRSLRFWDVSGGGKTEVVFLEIGYRYRRLWIWGRESPTIQTLLAKGCNENHMKIKKKKKQLMTRYGLSLIFCTTRNPHRNSPANFLANRNQYQLSFLQFSSSFTAGFSETKRMFLRSQPISDSRIDSGTSFGRSSRNLIWIWITSKKVRQSIYGLAGRGGSEIYRPHRWE